MERCPELEAWAAPLVERHAVVLHLASGRLGKIEHLYLPGLFVGVNGAAVDEYVLELATGDRFLLSMDGAWLKGGIVALSPVEVAFLDATMGALAKTIAHAVGAALVTQDGPFPVTSESALRLIGVALQGQQRALQRAPTEGGEG